MTARFFTLLSLGLALACSNKSDIPDDEASDPLATAAGFCGEWGKVACNADVIDACTASDMDACVEAQSEYCLDLLPSSGFAKDNAKRCLDAVKAAYADADLEPEELAIVRRLEGDCSQLIRGSVDEDGICNTRIVCDTVAGYECVIHVGEPTGTCQLPEEVGGGRSCAFDAAVCEDGFYCNGSNCLERLGEAASCDHDGECQAELRCTSGSCTARLDVGDPCTEDDDCKSTVCSIGSGDTEGICVARVRLDVTNPICDDLR
jgi:hypothetical protein